MTLLEIRNCLQVQAPPHGPRAKLQSWDPPGGPGAPRISTAGCESPRIARESSMNTDKPHLDNKDLGNDPYHAENGLLR